MSVRRAHDATAAGKSHDDKARDPATTLREEEPSRLELPPKDGTNVGSDRGQQKPGVQMERRRGISRAT